MIAGGETRRFSYGVNMKSFTTLTDIRRIMKMHSEGLSPEDISNKVFVDIDQVKHVIDVKSPKKKTRKKETPSG